MKECKTCPHNIFFDECSVTGEKVDNIEKCFDDLISANFKKKRCGKCKKHKPIMEFWDNLTKPSGKQDVCKVCAKE